MPKRTPYWSPAQWEAYLGEAAAQVAARFEGANLRLQAMALSLTLVPHNRDQADTAPAYALAAPGESGIAARFAWTSGQAPAQFNLQSGPTTERPLS